MESRKERKWSGIERWGKRRIKKGWRFRKSTRITITNRSGSMCVIWQLPFPGNITRCPFKLKSRQLNACRIQTHNFSGNFVACYRWECKSVERAAANLHILLYFDLPDYPIQQITVNMCAPIWSTSWKRLAIHEYNWWIPILVNVGQQKTYWINKTWWISIYKWLRSLHDVSTSYTD